MTVHADIPGYVTVRRGRETICAASVLADGHTLRDLEFMRPEYRKSNRTRQAACDALKKAGYK